MSKVKTDINFYKPKEPIKPAVYEYADRGTFPIHANRITLNGVHIITSKGSPLNVVSAPLGSLYLNQSGGAGISMYVKESETLTGDATGWIAK